MGFLASSASRQPLPVKIPKALSLLHGTVWKTVGLENAEASSPFPSTSVHQRAESVQREEDESGFLESLRERGEQGEVDTVGVAHHWWRPREHQHTLGC